MGENCGTVEEDLLAPENFTTSVGTVTDSSVELLLNATDNSGAVVYSITYGEVTTTVSGASGVEKSAIINNLSPETLYSFSVSATDAAGNSAGNNPIVVEATTLENTNTACAGTSSAAEQGSFSTGYTYAFETSGTNVTITFELLDSDKSDVVAYLWRQTPFAESPMNNTSGLTFSSTITDQTLGATISYAVKFAYAGGLSVTEYFSYEVGENCGSANCTSTSPTAITTSTICKNTNITLTAVGGILGSNAQYQWGTGNIEGENILEGETDASISLLISDTNSFWVRIYNIDCDTYTTAYIQEITVPAAVIWNGTWSATPNTDTAIEIQDNLTLNEDITACSCQVTGTANLTVAEGTNLTLRGKLTVAETATMTLENKASLLQTDDVQNEGNITVVRNSSKVMRLDYTVWSSPVQGQQLLEFSPMTLENRFYTLNTSENIYYHISPENDFELAESYLIRAPNDHPTTPTVFTGMFTGVPYNGTIVKPLEYTGTESSYSAIGNPYPSPINAIEFINTNSSVIEGTLWFWRKTNSPDETTYCTLTTLGFTANAAPGGTNEYSYNPNNELNTGQGFFVNTIAEGGVTFTNSMRIGNSSNQFFRTEPQDNNISRLWLNLTNTENNNFSQIMVGYTPQATIGYDNTIDGRSIADGPLKLYSLVDDNIKLTIQGRPTFENSDIVTIGYSATTAGEMKFEIDNTDGIFAQEQNIYLKDNFLNITHNISESSYIFATDIGTFNNRFEIIYTIEALGADFVDKLPNKVVVFREGKKVKAHASQEIQSVILYDLTGRILYEDSNIDNNEFSSTDLYTAQQVIIARVTLQNRQVISKKIMVD